MIVTSFRAPAAICAAGAAVFAALAAGTAIAGADANDDAFVAAVQQATTVKNPAALPNLGREICSDLGKGTSPDQIAADLMSYTSPEGGSMDRNAANTIVAAAKKSYCP
jgi:hypothetical protein